MFENFEKYTTFMYRPPEMIDMYLKLKVDTKVDMWMLGVLIYILNYCKDPFDESKLAIMNAKYYFPKEK
jgi:AP2-associated kinase